MERPAVSRFQKRFDVSRETMDRLLTYETLLRKWTPTINLVAKSTLEDIWDRHFSDSAELFKISENPTGRWVDIGTGGGFPGLVVAILADEKPGDLNVTCIESDVRKCEFLRTVARNTGLKISVLSRRIMDAPAQDAKFVSARALAPLTTLIEMAEKHLSSDGAGLFHKGKNWKQEVDEALEHWRFKLEKHDNPTHPESVILKIGEIARA